MTREEAIKRFQRMKKIMSIPNSDAARTIEAIDIAIEALKAQDRPIICPRCGRTFAESEGRGMTREEAIKVLSSYDVNGVWVDVDGKPYNAEEQAEALDMAIEALEREDTMLKEIERVVLYGERSEE